MRSVAHDVKERFVEKADATDVVVGAQRVFLQEVDDGALSVGPGVGRDRVIFRRDGVPKVNLLEVDGDVAVFGDVNPPVVTKLEFVIIGLRPATNAGVATF